MVLSLRRYLKWTGLSLLSGTLSGVAATVFLMLLDAATHFRDQDPRIIWLLPVAGFFIGWIYHHLGQEAARGTHLILDEIHDPKKTTPLRMAPFILFGTVLTHLFGGSAGREGAVVQMGASLADQFGKFFRVQSEERRILLVSGAGAGFGAALGTPWAGMIFGMEVIQVGRFRPFAIFECGVASFSAYSVARFLSAPHSRYELGVLPPFALQSLLWVAVAGVAFGIAARSFAVLTHGVERLQSQLISYPPFRPALAGCVLVALYYFEGSYRYVGLGIPGIQEALSAVQSFKDPLLKTIFTAITVGSGFKGGEFVPLVFIGTTLGSALSGLLPVSFQVLAGVGFAAVFAGAAKTPIACSIMAIELFGIEIAPYVVVGCLVSFFVSGNRGIYRSQKMLKVKAE